MKTVLIAEDNELLANLWKNALRGSDCQVHVARDGEQAMAIADRVNPDVVLMDIMMPKVDGLEAARNILARNPKTRLVFVSCLARSADIEEAHRMRAAEFLVKGRFSVQSLVDRVGRLLDDRKYHYPQY